MKHSYVRREFLGGPEGGGNTAYIDAYIDGKEEAYYHDAQFCLHDGNDNVHLHFELGSRKDYARSLRKAEALADAAGNFLSALQDWDLDAHLKWIADQNRKSRTKASKS